MSNLGFQEVYRLFNSYPAVQCERCFLYPPPFQDLAQTIESNRNINTYDIIAFSVSFELDYPHILNILKNAQIPFLARERNQWHPLVICGGTITMINPTPIAPLFDAFLLGEAKPLIDDFLKIILAHKKTGLRTIDCLAEIEQHSTFWAPNLHSPRKTVKLIQKDHRKVPIQSSIISPHIHFKNMHLIEVGRACGRGCRFCAAGYIYRPARFFSSNKIIELAYKNPFNTKKIGLIGSALSDYPKLTELCQTLVNSDYQLGLSSFRLDVMNSQFLNILEKSGVQSLTLAPEAGSERLRQIIHKQLTDEQIFTAFETISSTSISSLKLYFMIGLPFENKADIEAILEIIRKALRILKPNIRMTVSINTFIPKPMTPFQWCQMDNEKNLKAKRRYLTNELRNMKNVSVTPKSPRTEFLQGLFSLGDARVCSVILQQFEQKKSWNSILSQHRQMLKQVIFRSKPGDENFPWRFLTNPDSTKFLYKIWQETQGLIQDGLK
ncbi:MAG: radical SAM protein [Methanosarcinaceae archaeon]